MSQIVLVVIAATVALGMALLAALRAERRRVTRQQRLQAVVFGLECRPGHTQEMWLRRLPGPGVRHLALAVHPDNLLAIELVQIEPVASIVLDDPVLGDGLADHC